MARLNPSQTDIRQCVGSQISKESEGEEFYARDLDELTPLPYSESLGEPLVFILSIEPAKSASKVLDVADFCLELCNGCDGSWRS